MFLSRPWSRRSSKSKHGGSKRSYKLNSDHLSTHPKEEEHWYKVDDHSTSMHVESPMMENRFEPNAKPSLTFTPPSLPDLRSQAKREDRAAIAASAEDILNSYPPSPYELNVHPFRFNTSLNDSFGSTFTMANSTFSSVSPVTASDNHMRSPRFTGIGNGSRGTPHPSTTVGAGRGRSSSNTLRVPVSPLSPYIVARYVVQTPSPRTPLSANRSPTPVFNSNRSHSRSAFQSTPSPRLQASDSLTSLSTHESLDLIDTADHAPSSVSLGRPNQRAATVFHFPSPPSRNVYERSSLHVGRPLHQSSLTTSASQLSIHSLRSDVSASAGSTITTRSDIWMSRGQNRNSANRFRSFRRQTVPDPRFQKAYRSLRNRYYTGCMFLNSMHSLFGNLARVV